MPYGIVAGQAWESESRVSLTQYQRAKTGALFVAATCAGALSAGADPQDWRALGERLGEAYQIADDIRDVMGQADLLGKPVGRDAQHARPNAIASPNSASISHTNAEPPITARPAKASGCRASKRRPHHQLTARISGTSIATAAMAPIAGANHNVRIVPIANAMANTPTK